MTVDTEYVNQTKVGSSASPVIIKLSHPSKLRQLSVIFDGSDKDVRDSRVEISHGTSSAEFPTPQEIKKAHGDGSYGASLVSLIAYSNWNYTYGYTIRPEIEVEVDSTLELEVSNGSSNQIKFWSVIIYEE